MAISCRVDLSQILTHTHKSNLATCIKPNYLNKNLNVTGKKKKKKRNLNGCSIWPQQVVTIIPRGCTFGHKPWLGPMP